MRDDLDFNKNNTIAFLPVHAYSPSQSTTTLFMTTWTQLMTIEIKVVTFSSSSTYIYHHLIQLYDYRTQTRFPF
jgi:hypothetical protein